MVKIYVPMNLEQTLQSAFRSKAIASFIYVGVECNERPNT